MKSEKFNAIRVLLLQIYITISIVFRFFVGNIYGIFLLIIGCYFILPHVSQIKPYNFNELMIWFVSLDREYKISILSSVLTVIGFLIAFQVATTNWTHQMRTGLRLEASKDIESSYSKVTELISSIQIFIDMYIDLINKVEKNIPESEIRSCMTFLSSETPKFLSNRQELSNLHIRIYQLYGKYSFPLLATWNSFKQLEEVNARLSLVTQKTWLVHIPNINLSDSNYKEDFVKYSDKSVLLDLLQLCELNHVYISAVTGGVRGSLTSSLMEKNLATLISFWQMGKSMKEFFNIKKKK